MRKLLLSSILTLTVALAGIAGTVVWGNYIVWSN
jgi:hypothetical protein